MFLRSKLKYQFNNDGQWEEHDWCRRQFTAGLAAGSALLAAPSIAFGARPRVVVVGGGAGGATQPVYRRQGNVDVTLVEASRRYYTASLKPALVDLNCSLMSPNYYGLAVNNGVNVVHEWASSVDNAQKF